MHDAMKSTPVKRCPLLVLTLALSSLGLPGTAFSHHSFSAEFSRDMPVEVSGTVSNVEWMNPHARFYVDVKGDDGATVNWNFELTTPNLLMRKGWTRNSLKVGDTVTVKGWRARNDPHVANANSVTLASGKELFTGSAGANQQRRSVSTRSPPPGGAGVPSRTAIPGVPGSCIIIIP